MQADGKKLMLIAGAIVLTALLYFAPQKVKKEKATEHNEQAFSFEGLLKQAKGQLKRQELDPLETLEDELEKNPSSVSLLDTLGKSWDMKQIPAVAAFYYERLAEIKQDEKSWINAAYRFFDAFKSTDDSLLKSGFVGKAISSYRRVLAINPGNLDAKTDLGICYAEGTGSPMEGITLLREVVTENPEHQFAQYNLGVLSVRSGQYEKAAERFETVLRINPANVEARYLLGRTYMELKKNDLALENLEKVKRFTNDESIIKEVNSLISQINNH
jgi:cytochrome c-type biogenesis protein CcmH/NrfG